MNESVSAVILAAGLGTRMRSRTAKVLHRAGGLTLIELVVRTAKTAAQKVVAVVGHQAEQVRAVITPLGVETAEQAEQKGTAHAMLCCRGVAPPDGLLLVLYGDAPLLSPATLAELVERQRSSTAAATVLTAELDDATGYGRIVRGPDGTVEAIVEHRAASEAQRAIREINSGIYCFRAEYLWKYIDGIGTNNPAGEFYLTDIVELFRGAGLTVDGMLLKDPSELLGINTRVELALVDRVLRERKARELMLSGVTLERPESVTVDLDVTAGMDTVVESDVRLLGATTIGENCTIGAGSVLRNAVLGDGVTVAPYTLIEDSKAGAGAKIGPFARLRMNNEVGAHAHIGNFVELKKTRMGDGAKANHLAYLGDSDIGAKTNIGAGTITCNYDGKDKHPTSIGESVFVGSNSTLVAPITLASGSYVAAGSTITQNVPADALALGRSRQVIKDGWVKRKKS